MKNSITLDETRDLLRFIAQGMISSQDELTDADRAVGDGDHGVGMSRGFEAVISMLADDNSIDLQGLFKKAGMALITSAGGASGIIFGTWFIGGAKGLAGKKFFDSDCLLIFLQEGLKAVQERGKANAGDKTMVDVILPAAKVARDCSGQPLAVMLEKVTQAAKTGVEDTKNMVAAVGKAKTLGDRSLGYADPGAISAGFILNYMYDYIKDKQGG
jgi:phosphoenolpyruvate---glycerone phosphotransferase subunit DhaL